MRALALFTILIIITLNAESQVAINTTGEAAHSSAILDIKSSVGGILIPRLTTSEKTAIVSPANGLMVYDTDTDSFWYYDTNNTGWVEIITSATSSINELTDGINDGSSIFLGNDAGINDDASQNQNTAVGNNALETNTTGSYNSAYGYRTMRYNTTGYSNSAYGSSALGSNTEGNQNTALGSLSLIYNTTGNTNTATGYGSLKENITGNQNCTVGAYSSYNNTSGNANIILGYQSDYYNDGGSTNTIIGYQAGKTTSSHSKSGSIFLGYKAGFNETGSNKLYIENSNSSSPLIGGDFANDSIFLNGVVRITGGTPGADKILTSDEVGNATWETNTSANQINDLTDGKSDGSSVFLGNNAGINDDGTNLNIGIGINALRNTTSGIRNTASGSEAMYNNIDGKYNTANGTYSLYNNTNGESNTASGTYSLYNNINGGYNTAIGHYSLFSNISSSSNCAIGYQTLNDNTGEKNTALGTYAAGHNSTGSNNVTLGYASNYNNQTGANNTIIGHQAGRGSALHNKSGNIFLGYQAGYNETGSNKLYIENSNSSSPLIGGDFDADEVYFNTLKLGIGTSNPRELLEVASPSGSYGRMIVSDGGGDNRNVLLFVSPTVSNQTARIEAFNYDSGTGVTLNFNTVGNAECVFGGNVLPESHISKNLGASGQAWNNVYAHNYVTQGSAAFADIKVTQQLINFPPKEKQTGAFDEFTEKGLKELDPTYLPEALKENNAILIDEMTTYNYKANYEQQLQIEELITNSKKQESAINELKKENLRLQELVSKLISIQNK